MALAPLQLMGDERLAQLAVRGDRRAFDVLFERHRRGLQRCARSIVGNDHDAQDALQSAALKAFVGLAGRSPGAPLRPWLYRIASNEAISVLRRRRAQPSEELEDVLPDAVGGPEELLLVREDLRHLLEDLEHISERQRAALLMRQALGLEYDEIARRLRTTPLAARQCVFSARRALRRSADGREASCATVRVLIASGDGRALRAAPIRAHLRTCPACRAARPPARKRVAALFPALPSGIAEALRALGPSPAAEPFAAPLKTLAVAAVLTVGTGGVARDARRPPTQARHATAQRTAKHHAVAHRRTTAATATRVRTTIAAKPALVTAPAPVRRVQVSAPARTPKETPAPRYDDAAPAPQRQFADEPAPQPVRQARQPGARCHDPAPPATSQPAPTPG